MGLVQRRWSACTARRTTPPYRRPSRRWITEATRFTIRRSRWCNAHPRQYLGQRRFTRGEYMTGPAESIKPDGFRSRLIEAAQKVARESAGKDYKFGGQDTAGFDCSGYVSYVYHEVFSSFVYMNTKALASGGHFVETTKPQPGDLIFFPAG